MLNGIKYPRFFILFCFIGLFFLNDIIYSQSMFLHNPGEKHAILEVVVKKSDVKDEVSRSGVSKAGISNTTNSVSLEGIIKDSVKLGLEKQNLQVITRTGRIFKSYSKVSTIFLKYDVEYILIVSYFNASEDWVNIQYDWYAKGSSEPFRYSSRIKIGFDFDREIGKDIDVLLERVATISEAPLFRIESIPSPKKRSNTAKAAKLERKRLPVPLLEKSSTSLAGNRSSGKSVKKHFLFSLGFSPFFPIGKAREYFDLGLSPQIVTGYIFYLPLGNIQLGVSPGVNYFFALGSESFSNNFIAQLNFFAGYSTGRILRLPVGFDFFASSGPAAFIMLPNNGSVLAKIMLSIEGGIGIRLIFADYAGLSLKCDYSFVFDQVDSIMGIAPALVLYLKL